MAQEVRFKITGDTKGLDASFRGVEKSATALGATVERVMQRASKLRQQLTPGQARAADREFSDAVKRVQAEQKLAEVRRKRAYDEASTAGKIRIVSRELEELEKRRAQAAEGTTKQLEAQLAIEERMATLNRLKVQQAKESRNTSTPGASGGDSDGGAKSGGALAAVGRVITGAVTGALQRISTYFETQAQRAQMQAGQTESSLTSVQATIASINGLQGQLTQGRARVKQLEEDAARQLGVVNYIRGDEKVDPANFKTMAEYDAARAVQASNKARDFMAPALGIEQENAYYGMIAARDEQHSQNIITERDLKRQNSILEGQRRAVDDINQLRRSGRMNELEMARIELERLRGVERAEKAYGNPESQKAASTAVAEQKGVVQGARMALALSVQNTNQQLTQQVAGNRRTFPNGQPRPRSETERLADRAEQQRQRASDMAVVGTSGGNANPMSDWDRRYGSAIAARNARPGDKRGSPVQDLVNRAIRDESTVAGRLSRATQGTVANPNEQNLAAIKPELAKANILLSAIKDSLTSVSVEMK